MSKVLTREGEQQKYPPTYSAAKILVRYLKALSLSGLACKDFPLELETMSSSSSPRLSLALEGSFSVLFVSALLPVDVARACQQKVNLYRLRGKGGRPRHNNA